MMADEVHEGRSYYITTCHFCGERADWLVTINTDHNGELFDPVDEWMIVCQNHKFTAFS